MITGKEFREFINDVELCGDDFVGIDDGGLTVVVLDNKRQEVGRYEIGGLPSEEDTDD